MKNIVLTGIMGSGKTSVSKALLKKMPNFNLAETDSIIVEKEGISINRIFEKKGEKYFRRLEKTVIDNLINNENQIISLGGGSLDNNFDFETAKKTSVIFYLMADVDTIYERIKDCKDRPLLKCDNPKDKLKELLQKREPIYKKADFTIDTNDLTIEQITDEIERIYNEARNN